jgi:hypothetical protein
MTCAEMNKSLVDMFLESRPLSEEAKKHVAECPACAEELAGMERTWKLLDEWQAPEPSAFFDAKLYARLRQEKENAPAGFFERAKAWLLYSSNFQLRPVAAGALATVIAVGGGTFALLNHEVGPAPQTSATVSDLQSYDGNAQVFQQLNALDGDEDSGNGASN